MPERAMIAQEAQEAQEIIGGFGLLVMITVRDRGIIPGTIALRDINPGWTVQS
jgi:hypothetical protein